MNSDIEISNLNSLNNIKSSYIASKSSINNLDLENKKRNIISFILKEIIEKLYIAQRILSISLLKRSIYIVVKSNFLAISFNALNKYLNFNSFYKLNKKKIIYDYLKIDVIYVTFKRK